MLNLKWLFLQKSSEVFVALQNEQYEHCEHLEP